ncbi:hypothetical protein [Pararhizobium sp.]|uniref:hypothetical protein n=1 Tax=Pararhizobium sp. TaxID=1977563 RepID=UPI0027233304|nr:hypothetical protein [Pararhizobium sp.]MDO9416465.1 hypothetical protein [Pararhizobium sp.]
MLLPTQQASGTAALTLIQSTLESIEQRRAEEEEKLKGKKEDKILKARIASDAVSQAANAKINEHFFGSLKGDENPMAVLIARFAQAMGVAQGADESNLDFGTRLEDAMFLTDFVAKEDIDGNAMLVGPKTFRVTIEDLTATLDGTAERPSANAQFLARFVTKNGLEQNTGEDNGTYYTRLRESLTQARSELPASVAEVEVAAGLRNLGITAKQLIAAIRQPYGDDAAAVKAALDNQATEDKTSTAETAKVLQRLEDVADPKSLEELQVEKADGPRDPTEVEDAETRAEREQDIRSREAMDKLEDVKDLGDAVKEQNDKATAPAAPGEGTAGDETAAAIDTLQVLAAGAEIADTEAALETASGNETGSGLTGTAEPDYVAGEAMSAEDQAVLLADAAAAADQDRADAAKDILAIHVDENGIYDFLIRQIAA